MRYIFLLSSRKTQNSRTSARYTQRNQKFDQEIHNQPRMQKKYFKFQLKLKIFSKVRNTTPQLPDGNYRCWTVEKALDRRISTIEYQGKCLRKTNVKIQRFSKLKVLWDEIETNHIHSSTKLFGLRALVLTANEPHPILQAYSRPQLVEITRLIIRLRKNENAEKILSE